MKRPSLFHAFNTLIKHATVPNSTSSNQAAVLSHLPSINDNIDWSSYWNTQGQPWRTEPEIDTKRQQELSRYRAIVPDIEQGIYPFKGVKLSCADVEWLLATHENGRGPVDWSDESQRHREGLDLRGAHLEGVGWIGLPLAKLRGGVNWFEPQIGVVAADKLIEAEIYLQGASINKAHLEGANLFRAHLEGAYLEGAHLEQTILYGAVLSKANLYAAHIEDAILSQAHLQEAELTFAHFERTPLHSAHLEKATLSYTRFEGADLYSAHLEGARLNNTFFDGATRLNNITLSNERDGNASLVDVQWGDVNLAVIDWSKIRKLGNEVLARRRKQEDGRTKDALTRMAEYSEAVRANRQLAVALQAQGMNEEAARFAYGAQVLQMHALRYQMFMPRVKLRQRMKALGSWLFSWFLFLLAGYGYRPGRSVVWYLAVICGFAAMYTIFGRVPLFPDAFVFSLTSFHGRGFFPGFGSQASLHNPLVELAAIEAVVGLFIEISFIATFTQRFFGK